MSENQSKSNKPVPSVRLVRSKEATESLGDDVLVVPMYSSWNDFGISIHAELGFRLRQGGREWLSAYFAFKDRDNLAGFIKESLLARDESAAIAEIDIPYASMLTESKHYSLLRRSLGREEATRVLRALHDVSVLTADDDDVPSWADFFTSKAFTHAMSRSSEGYFAYRHGALYLQDRGASDVDARSPLEIKLEGKGPQLSFRFRFDAQNALRGRIAVLIGENGCGKTSALARLAKGLATNGRLGASLVTHSEVNQVLAFAHSGAVRQFRQRRSRHGATSLRVFSLDPHNATRKSSRDLQTRLLVDVARGHDDSGPLLDYLNGIIEAEFPALRMHVPISADAEPDINPDYFDGKERQYISLKKWMRRSEGRRLSAAAAVDHSRDLLFLDTENNPRSLSLGQAGFLNFVLTALANAGPASVLLVDEPENFLHPKLLSRFVMVLHRILEGTKSIAIVATHSPFVVREVQSAQVHIIRTKVDNIGVFTPFESPRLS